jgi:parallel beta helix pectate lyase-like protein
MWLRALRSAPGGPDGPFSCWTFDRIGIDRLSTRTAGVDARPTSYPAKERFCMHDDGLSVDDRQASRSPRRLRRIAVLASTVMAAGALVPAGAAAATLSATPSNLSSKFSSTQAGDTVLLASGSYGTFSGAMKSGEVTLESAPGAAVTMALSFRPAANVTIDGVTLTEIEIADSRTKNITVRNSDIPGQTTLRTGELQNANILFDHNVHRDWDACSGCGEGRVWLPENSDRPSGITIQNSEFKGGLSDGIQNGSNGTRILNNVFHDLRMGTPDGVHSDAIQLYGSKNTLIKGNYFHDVPDAIMAPDGADHETIEDNVIAADPDGYPFAVTLYSDDASTIRHNTFADGACAFNLRCGILRIGAKSGDDAGRGTTIEDDVLGEISDGDGSATVSRNSHNLFSNRASGLAGLLGKPSFVGGAKPTDYASYALKPGSLGTASASDGLDRGIRVGARAPSAESPRASARVLSSLRSIRKTGRLRVRIVTPVACLVAVSGRVRPRKALAKYRGGHLRKTVKLRTISLGQLAAGPHTVTFKVGRKTRRSLGRAKSARLSLSVAIDGQATSTELVITR